MVHRALKVIKAIQAPMARKVQQEQQVLRGLKEQKVTPVRRERLGPRVLKGKLVLLGRLVHRDQWGRQGQQGLPVQQEHKDLKVILEPQE